MVYAEKIEFSDRPPICIGGTFNGFEVSKIEIYHDEYENHSEMTAIWYHHNDQIGKSWNYPIIVTYKR
jgi:hypothetical protein